MSYMPTAMVSGSYLPPVATAPQIASGSWVPPTQQVQAVETIMYEPMQPIGVVAQPVVAMAQPVYAQTAVAQSIGAAPTMAVGSLDMLNQAISLGEVAKPTGASAYYDLYCKMSGQAMPTAVATTSSMVPQQNVMTTVEKVMTSPSYLPPAATYVEMVPSYAPVAPTIVETVPEFAMREQMQTYSYLPQCIEPVVMAAPTMAAPMMTTVAAPGMAIQQGQPESVILDEVGDWLICEDAMGLFYHHTLTQQSYDQPPLELVQYYESQGVQLAPTGAFGVQAAMVQAAPMQMNYTVPQAMPGVYF